MGAKIALIGEPKDIRQEDQAITFYVLTGPGVKHAPKGLELYGPVRYQVECTARQWNAARQGPDDDSDLLIEGYQQPRQDAETGELYIAVVATSLQSMAIQNQIRRQQLEQALAKARDAYRQAREAGAPREELEQKAAALVKANEGLGRFLERHPEVAARQGGE